MPSFIIAYCPVCSHAGGGYATRTGSEQNGWPVFAVTCSLCEAQIAVIVECEVRPGHLPPPVHEGVHAQAACEAKGEVKRFDRKAYQREYMRKRRERKAKAGQQAVA